MTKTLVKIETLSERLEGYQVALNCAENINNTTIGDYFGRHKDKLKDFLALPSSKRWKLTANEPLALITLAKDDDFPKENQQKALDLIIYPIVAADYDYPLFRFTLRAMSNLVDDRFPDDDAIECHKDIFRSQNWISVLDKSINAAIQHINTLECNRYLFLDGFLSVVFGDLYQYYDASTFDPIND